MKIGILTLQSGYNYGGTLQCLALQNSLISMGHEVSVINYYPVLPVKIPWWRGWGLSGITRVDNCRKRFLQLRYLEDHTVHFDCFKKAHLNLTERCHTPEEVGEVASKFDALVVGSDQVWNLKYHPDPTYYLAYPPDFKGLKISYAACCGRDTGKADNWVAERLREFDIISVRDSFTASWVHAQIEGACPQIVGDPTLLYNFPAITIDAQKRPKRYIFAYIIGDGNEDFHRRAIPDIKRKYGDISVVCAISTGYKIQLFRWADETLLLLDPYEWVEWLANATFVYTDSFHGVLFSLKYNREFLAYYSEEIRAPRLIDLRERFELSHRVIETRSTKVSAAIDVPIEWDDINEKIRLLSHQSLSYLRNSL
jgi:hypothetical protein